MADIYYDCHDEGHGGLCALATSVIGVGSDWPRSHSGRVRVTMRDADVAPAAVAACPDCRPRSYDEQVDDQHGADWIDFAAGHVWTGTEKAVLVPELDGTADMAATLGIAWQDCERIAAGVTVTGVGVTTQRMAVVRYTGAKPAPLASYSPTIYAADLPAVLAVAEPA